MAFHRYLRTSVTAAGLGITGCGGPQSALDPAGREAEQIYNLFWWMTVGAAVVWIAVIALACYSIRSQPRPSASRRTSWMIIGGGAIVPAVVLAVLLAYGLAILPSFVSPAPEGSLRITVAGEQWWWRVRYELPGREPFELANEVRLPVGESVDFRLSSTNVIHSFWIPSLGGKIDMIPGRSTHLSLRPGRTGAFRGACAEYCGASHAMMSFYAVVLDRQDFARWVELEASPAQTPVEPDRLRGQEVFLGNGCGACHTIRGTAASGVIGPDLTHVGSRMSLAAGILPNQRESFARWIAHTREIKPGALMPAFSFVPQGDLQALAAYLEGLQ